MADDKPPIATPKDRQREQRDKRLADALRANLRRRKATPKEQLVPRDDAKQNSGED